MHFDRSLLRTLMLPAAMAAGAVFYKWIGELVFLSPYLIFAMLFITYCKLKVSDIKPDRFETTLLAVQMILAVGAYGLAFWWNKTLAEGLFICFFVSTATAAPVITSMLGGSISKVASYSLLSNAMVAVGGPLAFAAVGEHPEISFVSSFFSILKQVFPLLVLPLVTALIMRRFAPGLHRRIEGFQQLSFYLWAVSLFIVVGNSVAFAVGHWTPESSSTMAFLAVGALIACLAQFKIGRKVGDRFGDKVAGGQSLGQKNTVLAIWLALAYMNPVASIAPAAYVAWQNIVNSWQLMRHRKVANRA